MKRSKRELWRLLDDIQPKAEPEVDISSTVHVVMERERAEQEGYEIIRELEGSVSMARASNESGEVVWESETTTRVPDSVTLVEADPESNQGEANA